MVMKALVEKLDDVPEALREHYKEIKEKDTGVTRFLLDVDTIDPLPGVKMLRGENASWRTKLREAEAKYDGLGALKDMDPKDVIAKLDRIAELEAANGGKLDEGQIEKIVEGRIKSKLSPIERERDTLKNENATLKQQLDDFTAKDRQRLISDAVRAAATELKMEAGAIEDAIMYAERVMEVDEEGKVVVKDKVGFTPGIDTKTWLTDMQPKKPHWWGPSFGGGARGSFGGGQGGGKNPWTAENWNVTEQTQIYKQDAKRAEQLAINAGTTIGGRKPAPKK